jgi:hypothetical protein
VLIWDGWNPLQFCTTLIQFERAVQIYKYYPGSTDGIYGDIGIR